jgi:hypothetical protein
MTDHSNGYNTRYKVGRVLSEYDLPGLHNSLPDLWRGDSADSMSLRELADHINVAILKRSLEQNGETPLEGEPENAYRLLTDPEVSAGMRAQQRNRLARVGIDVDRIEQNFVTHQAVHTYLTEALNVSKETEPSDPVEKNRNRIARLRGRTGAVVENALSELQNTGDIEIGAPDVFVDIKVYCSECETQVQLSKLLAAGGCECDTVGGEQ